MSAPCKTPVAGIIHPNPVEYNSVCYSSLCPFVPTMPRGFARYYNKYHPYTTLRTICINTCPPYTSSTYRC